MPTFMASIFEILPKVFFHSDNVQFMEQMDIKEGLVLYDTNTSCTEFGTIAIDQLKDFANVYIDKEYQLSLYSGSGQDSFKDKCVIHKTKQIDILVENMGRYNFGNPLFDRKGITNQVTLNGKAIKNWNMYPLHLSNLDKEYVRNLKKQIPSSTSASLQPGNLFEAEFTIQQVGDTYLDMSGW